MVPVVDVVTTLVEHRLDRFQVVRVNHLLDDVRIEITLRRNQKRKRNVLIERGHGLMGDRGIDRWALVDRERHPSLSDQAAFGVGNEWGLDRVQRVILG